MCVPECVSGNTWYTYAVLGFVGVATLYTLYIGYLAMEMRSIFENYKKFGFETGLLEAVLDLLKSKDGNNQL